MFVETSFSRILAESLGVKIGFYFLAGVITIYKAVIMVFVWRYKIMEAYEHFLAQKKHDFKRTRYLIFYWWFTKMYIGSSIVQIITLWLILVYPLKSPTESQHEIVAILTFTFGMLSCYMLFFRRLIIYYFGQKTGFWAVIAGNIFNLIVQVAMAISFAVTSGASGVTLARGGMLVVLITAIIFTVIAFLYLFFFIEYAR